MRNELIKYYIAITLLMLSSFFRVTYATPALAPKLSALSGPEVARMMVHVNTITEFGPRNAGSMGHQRTRDYIATQLESLGYIVERQKAFICRGIFCGTVTNVIARPVTSLDKSYVGLSAHYDTHEGTLGAGDNAANVAILLEIARLAKQESTQIHNNIALVFTDAEEMGLLGAEAFARNHGLKDQLTNIINLDAKGSSGPSLLFQTTKNAQWIVQRYSQLNIDFYAISIFQGIFRLLSYDTDLTVYEQHGMSGVNLGFIGNGHLYHTYNDNAENLSRNTLLHQAQSAYQLAGELVVNPNNESHESNNKDLIYSDILSFGMLILTQGEVLILSIGCCLVIGWFFFARARLLNSSRSVNPHLLQSKARLFRHSLSFVLILLLTVVIMSGIAVGYAWLSDKSFFVGDMTMVEWSLYITISLLITSQVIYLILRNVDELFSQLGIWLWYSLLALILAIWAPSFSIIFFVPAMLFTISRLLCHWFCNHAKLIMAIFGGMGCYIFIKLIWLSVGAFGIIFAPFVSLMLMLSLLSFMPLLLGSFNNKVRMIVPIGSLLALLLIILLINTKSYPAKISSALVVDNDLHTSSLVISGDFNKLASSELFSSLAESRNDFYPWYEPVLVEQKKHQAMPTGIVSFSSKIISKNDINIVGTIKAQAKVIWMLIPYNVDLSELKVNNESLNLQLQASFAPRGYWFLCLLNNNNTLLEIDMSVANGQSFELFMLHDFSGHQYKYEIEKLYDSTRFVDFGFSNKTRIIQRVSIPIVAGELQ